MVDIMKYVVGLFFCLAVLLQPVVGLSQQYESNEAAHLPWSGYWWPFNTGGLATGIGYRGHPAPLEKYELLTNGDESGPLVSWYKEHYYDPDTLDWYGHCGDWARAASFENYEIWPSSENNIVFRVGDKKGLLTLAHNQDISEWGNANEFPQDFHYWLLYYIGEKKRAFIADLDAGEEIWNYPIYKYEMHSNVSGNVKSVRVKIHYATDNVEPDYMGTLERTATYTYDLFLDGDKIVGGEWTGESIDDHPQQMFYTVAQRTNSPYLDYEKVVEVARSRDDFLEKESEDETVRLSPGTYHLILMDADRYRLDCQPGDQISIEMEKQLGSFQDIEVGVENARGEAVGYFVVDDSEPMELELMADTPPYFIHVSQTDYDDPNIYTLKIDIAKNFSQTIPYVPKNGMWRGFALTHPEQSESEEILLIAYNGDGEPIQTLMGPLSLMGGEKRLFFFDDLSYRKHEYGEIEYLRLQSDAPVEMLNLIGKSQGSMACFVQGNARADHLIIPDTISLMNWEKSIFAGMINEAFADNQVMIRSYETNGDIYAEEAIGLAGKQNYVIRPGNAPFYDLPDGGWLEIEAEPESNLIAYQYLAAGNGLETLFALRPGTSKIVPHIPPPGYWATSLTLINPQSTDNQITLHLSLAGEDQGDDIRISLGPKEKTTLALEEPFGRWAGDPLYHSILEVTGTSPFAGYFSYQTVWEEDSASLPLMDASHFNQTLTLPHYPGDTDWWTGFGICNPSSQPTQVIVEPYDQNGQAMADSVAYIWLEPGAYDVRTVKELFPEDAKEIAFLKYRAEDEAAIGGFYLYGSKQDGIANSAMLSGALMR